MACAPPRVKFAALQRIAASKFDGSGVARPEDPEDCGRAVSPFIQNPTEKQASAHTTFQNASLCLEIEKEVVNAKKTLEKDFASSVMSAVKKIVAKEVSMSNYQDTVDKSLDDFRK